MKKMLERPAVVDNVPISAMPTGDQIYPTIERKPVRFDPKHLQRLLDGEHVETRNFIKDLITQPEFRFYEGTDVATYRRKVLDWTRRVTASGIWRACMPRAIGGEENLPKFMAAFETLAFHDISLVIKLGVQFGLFAGSIQRLGTD